MHQLEPSQKTGTVLRPPPKTVAPKLPEAATELSVTNIRTPLNLAAAVGRLATVKVWVDATSYSRTCPAKPLSISAVIDVPPGLNPLFRTLSIELFEPTITA